MKNSVIIYKGDNVPEKNLIKAVYYGYQPSSSMRDIIIEDVKKHLKCDLDEYVIGIDVTVSLKEYDVKPEPKQFWYDEIKPTNDTKDT
jgi:hypothetical protein